MLGLAYEFADEPPPPRLDRGLGWGGGGWGGWFVWVGVGGPLAPGPGERAVGGFPGVAGEGVREPAERVVGGEQATP